MNILIVEDDIIFASQIARALARRAFSNRIDIAGNIGDFKTKVSSISTYDIVLVDMVLLPVYTGIIQGYSILESLRDQDIPIIVMSGIDDIEVLGRAFELGALDYLCKPFRLAELEVRIDHWFQRFYTDKFQKHTFIGEKQLLYDIKKHEFTFKGNIIPLSRIEKYLMSLFMREPGRLFSYEYICDRIWGDRDTLKARNIRVPIMRLRRSLMPFSIDSWIITLPGEGYRFDPP